MLSLVLFTLADREYAMDICHVQQVVRMVAMIPIPDAPPELLGAINVHSVPTPVIDLRQRLGLPPGSPTSTSPLLLVNTGHVLVAALVDRVNGVVKVRTTIDAMGLVRLGERLIAVLDPVNILTTSIQSMLLEKSNNLARR